MRYQINFLPEAIDDMKKLNHSVHPQVAKGIQKVSENPVSIHQGGYGKLLGNKDGISLSGLYKIKFRGIGIRVVYSLEEHDGIMNIIVGRKKRPQESIGRISYGLKFYDHHMEHAPVDVLFAF